VVVTAEAGLMEMAPKAQWSDVPREALMVNRGLVPSTIEPAPITLPPPAMRFHCSAAGGEKVTDVHVSQEKTPRASSPSAEGIVTLAELLSA